jgi:ATP-dependent helicase/nuclease subunit B
VLRLLIGSAGSGKTKRLMSELLEGGAERPVRRVLIVPEQYSHQTERELCSMGGDSVSLYAEVLSFTGLARRVFSQAGGAAQKFLDQGGRLLIMRRALDRIRPSLKIYANAVKPEFLSSLIKSVEEFKTCNIPPESLIEAAGKVDFSEKLSEIAVIMEAYDSLCREIALDPADRLALAAQALKNCDYLRGAEIYIDSFTDFTEQESEILAVLMERAASVTVALTLDRLSEDGKEVFAVSRRSAARLIETAKRLGQRFEVISLSGGTRPWDLTALEEGLYDYAAQAYTGAPPSIRLFRAVSPYSECRAAAAEILRLVREEGFRFSDILVTVRDMEAYRAVLESVFESYGVPLFIGGRTDILQKPAAAFVTAALDVVSGGFEYEDMFRCLRTGLFGIPEEELDILENYVILWKIRGSMWWRDEPWTLSPEGYGAPADGSAMERLERINQTREKIRQPFVRLRNGVSGKKTARRQLQALYAFMLDTGMPERIEDKADSLRRRGELRRADEYRQLWDILVAAMEQFDAVLGDAELPREEIARLFRLVLSASDVDTIPVSLDRVQAVELTRVGHGHARILFVLGATDTYMPMVAEDTGVFSDSEREALRSLGLRLSGGGREKLERELYAIYAAFSEPRERLYISWPAAASDGTEQRPSFAVARITALFPDARLIYDDGRNYPTALEPCFEAAARALTEIEPDVRDLAALRALETIPSLAGRLNRLKSASRRRRGSLSPQSVRRLYGEAFRLSASKIDSFNSCKFGYFMKYGLRARPRRPAGFQAPETGTFIHYVLENVLRDAEKGGGAAACGDRELKKLVRHYVNQYVINELHSFRDKTERFKYLFNRLAKSVETIVLDMVNELRVSEFRPLEFELEFGKNGKMPPVALVSQDGEITITGLLDRVDGWEKDGRLYLRVVDYKTGRKSFDLTDIANGLGLQLLIYLFALEKGGKRLFGKETVPAGVLYIPARDKALPLPRRTTEEERLRTLSAELRRSGVILDDRSVIEAMENLDGREPRFLPVKLNKAGEVTGEALLSAEKLGKLGRYIDRLLAQLASELARGNTSADPYEKNGRTACDWCDYASACHFEEGLGSDCIRVIETVKPSDFWQKLSEGGAEDV